MFTQARRLLDDMIGIIEEFQPFRRKADAVAVPFQNGNVKFFFQLFSSSFTAVLRLGWAMNKAWAAAEIELCFDNSTM